MSIKAFFAPFPSIFDGSNIYKFINIIANTYNYYSNFFLLL